MVFPSRRQVSARPLRGRHMLHLRVRRRTLRSVRQLRQRPGAGEADRAPVHHRRWRLELRDTEHYYLNLSKLEPDVKAFLAQRADHMRDTVLGESLGKIESEGLKARPSPAISTGGYPCRPRSQAGRASALCLVRAVIGYLSAAIEWAQLTGRRSGLEAVVGQFRRQAVLLHWEGQYLLPHVSLARGTDGCGQAVREVFSGQDYELTLPFDVPANQFMNLEGQKISGSRKWAVWGADFLSGYDPMHCATISRSTCRRTRTAMDWSEFVARNNN